MTNNLTVNKLMEKELDGFLATKTCTDIDRTKFIPFSLKDKANKLTTCFIFNCNGHTYEDPTIIPCEYTGAVIYLPAFWLEVPKELSYEYIMGIINDIYKDTYTQWAIDGKLGCSSSTESNNSIPNCPCNNNWTPV